MKGETDRKRAGPEEGRVCDGDQQDRDLQDHDNVDEFYHRLALAPDNTELRLHLAQWLAQHGQRIEALEELRVLVRLDPNHLVARKLREELLRDSPESNAKAPAAPRTSEALH